MSMIPLLVIQITALLPEQHLRHCRKIGSARNAEHPKLTFPRNNFFADQLKKTLLRSILFLNSFFLLYIRNQRGDSLRLGVWKKMTVLLPSSDLSDGGVAFSCFLRSKLSSVTER